MLTEYKRGSFCPGSHLQYYALTMDPSGFSASSRPTADSEFSLDLVSVEEDNLVTRSECVCFVCEVQSFPVLLRAAWGSLSFYGLLGSQCRWGLVCPKSCPWTVKEYAARERLFRLTDCNSWSQASWMEARQDKSWATPKYYTVAGWMWMFKGEHPINGFPVTLNL